MDRYAELSREQLVARLYAYEKHGPPAKTPAAAAAAAAAPSATAPAPTPAESKSRKKKHKDDGKTFSFGVHPTRHVALLVAYHGWPYSGLAIQPTSAFDTVEGELLKALEKCRLVEPGKGWEGCGFSRCGRTDRGVSGEGQVLSLWIRSNRKEGDGGYALGDGWRAATEEKPPKPAAVKAEPEGGEAAEAEGSESTAKAKAKTKKEPKPQPKSEPAEIAYPRLLNGVLPPSIRILAWSPVAADFDSRFSTEYRHYKYAFHQHAIHGRPPLDLQRMEEAAALLLGEHDFRNFCKLDGSKQIENHSRRVIKAWFEPGPLPDQIVFNLIGTAFLWHQVRHIIAVLFLVGSGLEQPSIVSDLLDVHRFPGKPGYNMGHPLPLTLHRCEYKPGTLDWRFGPYDGPWGDLEGEAREKVRAEAETGLDQFERQLESARQEAEIRAWQVGGALRRVKEVLGEPTLLEDTNHVVTGAGETFHTKTWHPVAQRPMGDTPETTNRKWREQKTRTGKLPAHLKADDE
ncbi:tRNA pseudouridine synthase [Cutaneotrichosporon oleaginosum]|uniref:tRNA pseudouridine synthase n=1 Tax=Cutaneotrichosporon oleaginosum TaxID=879819 RepID=A0A0J0XSG3_9TREE|nr:tRNA pseudouridine synthase [Cutaneotrichosporon oleaginosum]KLT44000.1 tRNA pseudouridine synthase [Cutaneotrichosporon oleaginosum]TXT04054.1 hypothetical protein COLE_07751 [Cutaneotrichosporon oleaginosum]